MAAPLSAELPAKLSAKEQKAAVKKLNKEKKKTPLVLGGAVFNAHPSRATAAAASDVPGVSGAVTSPVSAADTCTAHTVSTDARSRDHTCSCYSNGGTGLC